MKEHPECQLRHLFTPTWLFVDITWIPIVQLQITCEYFLKRAQSLPDQADVYPFAHLLCTESESRILGVSRNGQYTDAALEGATSLNDLRACIEALAEQNNVSIRLCCVRVCAKKCSKRRYGQLQTEKNSDFVWTSLQVKCSFKVMTVQGSLHNAVITLGNATYNAESETSGDDAQKSAAREVLSKTYFSFSSIPSPLDQYKHKSECRARVMRSRCACAVCDCARDKV